MEKTKINKTALQFVFQFTKTVKGEVEKMPVYVFFNGVETEKEHPFTELMETTITTSDLMVMWDGMDVTDLLMFMPEIGPEIERAAQRWAEKKLMPAMAGEKEGI